MSGRSLLLLAVNLLLGAPLGLLLTACGATETPTGPGEAAPDPSSARAETSEAASVAAPVDTYYDLVGHQAQAVHRLGGVPVIDFRRASSAQATFGGWKSHFRQSENGVRYVEGTRGTLTLPQADEPIEGLTLKLLVPSGRLELRIDGDVVGTIDDAPRTTFETRTVRLSAPVASTFNTRLELRSRGTGTVDGANDVGVAIAWIRLLDEGPTPAAMSDQESDASIAMQAEAELRFSFQVPADGRIRGSIASGTLVAHVRREGEEDVQLPRLEGQFDSGLEQFAGSFVELSLKAEGATEVTSARIVVPQVEQTESQAATNAVIYLIDTLRPDKLSAYNPQTRVTTPGMNRFAERSALMRRAHTQENWTKPSVATLMSSLFPWEHNAVTGESRVPQSVTLISELLTERGFFTGSFIANGYVSDRFGFGEGWDTYRNYIRESRNTDAENVAHDVLGWLDNRPEEEPFFLYIHTIDPHVPYRPPAEFLSPYFSGNYRGPVTPGGTAQFLADIKTGRRRPNSTDRAYIEALHDGEISYHDVHFNAIMEGLERRGLADNTVVIVTADHGEEFWDHGSVGHGHNVYEELLHIPMLVRLPGQQDAREVSSAVGLVDVMPTVLEALGQEVPDDLSGSSFLSQLHGAAPAAPRYTVAGFMDNFRVVVLGDYKLICRGGVRYELYDLAADPGEETNLVEQRPMLARHLRGLLGLRLDESQSTRGPTRRRRQQHRRETTTIDDETAAQLRALGYVE